MEKLPALGHDAWLRLSRQGGVAVFPARARPREIDLAQYDSHQRGRLCSVLERCLPLTSSTAGAGDQRFYRIELHFHRDQINNELVLQVPEERAPAELVTLWQNGSLDGD
ncbi:hypothetical protein N8H22_09645 [Stutzerimonas stutzeri]|uniref:protealysin inhibitor emfourin n=1 Tax=Stutzerimonas sp. S1 TaxID=3030652 RepID=UPI002225426C|nr:protealysin inhibitor emfourin [Stutzerimonas sp. S1]MCW3148857.1 hypothetical protein [Stutzerimonas sp. S1]